MPFLCPFAGADDIVSVDSSITVSSSGTLIADAQNTINDNAPLFVTSDGGSILKVQF